MGTYTSDNALCEKVVWQANAEDYQRKIFTGKMFEN